MEKSMAKSSIKLDQIVSLISKLPSPPRLAERSDTIWPAHKFLEPYNRTAKEFLFLFEGWPRYDGISAVAGIEARYESQAGHSEVS